MTRELSQSSQHLENFESLIVRQIFIADLIELRHGGQTHLIVSQSFVGRQIHHKIGLGAARQVFQNFAFGASQNERGDHLGQRRTSIALAIFFDRCGKATAELFPRSQHARSHCMEDAPEFAQMVFHRRACECNFPFGFERANLSGCFTVAVFDVLSFVQNQRAPFDVLQQFSFAQSQTVTADDKIAIAHFVLQVDSINVAEQNGRQRRSKSLTFFLPVEAQRCGSNHQRWPRFDSRQQQRQSLNRFAEPHVVRQNAADAPVRQAAEPAKTFQLIVSQIGVQTGRRFRRGVRGFAKSLETFFPVLVGFDLDLCRFQSVHDGRGRRIQLQLAAIFLTDVRQSAQRIAKFFSDSRPFAWSDFHQPVRSTAVHSGQQFLQRNFLIADLAGAREPEPVSLTSHFDSHVIGRESPDHIKTADGILMPQHHKFTVFDKNAGIGEQRADVVAVGNSPAPATERNTSPQFQICCQFTAAADFFCRVADELSLLVIDRFMDTSQAFARSMQQLVSIAHIQRGIHHSVATQLQHQHHLRVVSDLFSGHGFRQADSHA